MQTLVDCGGPVDFLLVDGWPRLALSVLKLVTPQLRPGAIVACDQSGHAPSDRASYRDFVRDPAMDSFPPICRCSAARRSR